MKTLTLDCDFPGGNIIVDTIDADHVYIRQDQRGSTEPWFYWYFGVRNAGGRTLTFHFTDWDVIGVRGPAISNDDGLTWRWLGRETVQGASFTFDFPPADAETRFSFGFPYTQDNLTRFLARFARHPHLKRSILCRSNKGRDVELLHVGRLDGHAPHRVVLAARHHACEMMASYALEGVIESLLAGTDDGQWARQNLEVLIIPFADKDGVELGDQGKSRHPRDHGRDYLGGSLYAETRAIRQLLPEWSADRLRVALDLHCPWIRGQHNEHIYFVGTDNAVQWQRTGDFARILESVRTGPLPYHAQDNLPFGTAWNTGKNYTGGMGFHRWSEQLPGNHLSGAVELPYANVSGVPVTADSARAFGRDLAKAMRIAMQNEK